MTIFNYNNCKFVAGAQYYNQIPRQSSIPDFPFIGRSNVGKSTMINMLLQSKKVARTSSNAGCTRQINFFSISDIFMLVDMPGYGYAKMSKNQKHIMEKLCYDYFTNREQIAAIFVLIDSRRMLTANDDSLLLFLAQCNIKTYIIFTKSDKLSSIELDSAKSVVNSIVNKYHNVQRKSFFTTSKNHNSIQPIIQTIMNEVKTWSY